MNADFPLVQHAIAFAARAHKNHVRKDGITPYASHTFRVCLTVRHVFGVDDPRVLAAAVLHDTVEDTTTDHDDLEAAFGPEVAGWVSMLSKDKRLPDAAREAAYNEGLAKAPWQVKVCKLADIYDNIIDSSVLAPETRLRTLRRSQFYLDALARGLSKESQPAFDRVSKLLADVQATAAAKHLG